MYTRSKKIIENKLELGNYIENYDLYNSLFLREILNSSLPRVEYKINNYEYRPDLISLDFYGSTDYTAILIISTGVKVEELIKGKTLYLLPKDIIDTIINSL